MEERAVEAFIRATNKEVSDDNHIYTYGMPDADDVRKYGHILAPHIEDRWYVDMGVEDLLREGEYFFVDTGSVCKGNEYRERAEGFSKLVGIRAFYAVDENAIVTIEA